jgi:predicted permease
MHKLMLLLPWVRRKREQTLEQEFRSYLEMAEEEARRSGRSAEEAAYAARRDLGNMLRAKEDVRSEWISPRLEQVVQDVRYAIRSLKRTPLFTVVAVLSLALGIGAAGGVFSLVDGILLKPLAYRDSGQLVYVQEVVPALSRVYPRMPVNIQHFSYWHDHVRAFEGLCALRSSAVTLTGGGEPEQIDSVDTSADLFRVLKTDMAQGRGFLRGEDEPGKNNVAVITDSLWQRRLHRAGSIVGQSIVLDGRAVTIVGILRPGFTFPKAGEMGSLAGLGKRTEIFLPIQDRIQGWDGDYDYIVIGRLNAGVSLAQGLAELGVLTKQMVAAHQVESQPRPVGQPFQDVIGGSVRAGLMVLQAAVLVLLLIVCVNLANLMMARANGRVRKFSIRTALGAGRRRLLQQLLTESFVLSLAGGALGVLLAGLAVRLFVARANVDIPRLDEVHLNGAVVFFSLALTVACVCLFGLLPAYRIARSDLQEAMKATGQSLTANKQSLRLREMLVGCEVALSTVLVFLAGLLSASLLHLTNIDKGFHEERAVAMDLSIPDTRYRDAAAQNRFFERALSELRALPGVRSAAMINALPLRGESQVNGIELAGSNADWIDPASRTQVLINVRFVSDGYFETLGIPLVSGRTIQERDRSQKVTVISERLAAKVWPGQNPIGKKFRTGSQVGEVQVVGVAHDTYNGGLDGQPTLIAYVPYQIRPLSYGSLLVRSASDPASLMREMRGVIWSIDSNLSVSEVRTMSELVDQALARRRFQMRLAAAFGAGALLLALIGIYGVVAYNVEQRRGELGLRLALGAEGSELIGLMLKRGLWPVFAGLACGLMLSIALGAFVRSLVYGVTTSDPFTMFGVVTILGITGFLACLLPASKAARMDPAAILRHE